MHFQKTIKWHYYRQKTRLKTNLQRLSQEQLAGNFRSFWLGLEKSFNERTMTKEWQVSQYTEYLKAWRWLST